MQLCKNVLHIFNRKSTTEAKDLNVPNMVLSDFVCGVYILQLSESMLTSSAVDCDFEPQSGQTKDYKIGI